MHAGIRHKVSAQLMNSIPVSIRRRVAIHLGRPDPHWSLSLLRRLGFNPRSTMDVGAFVGDWSRICLRVFPETHITCVEPQDATQKQLQELASRHSNVRVVKTLLGRQERTGVPFAGFGPGSSVLLSGSKDASRQMTTIDRLIDDGLCQAPELLKLDVQGYEMEILEGYINHFDACRVIQCELSLLPLIPGAPLLQEMMSYLDRRGFVMFDIDEIIHGPKDGAVWQIDAIFCRTDSSLRNERVWR
jgi:FkbM family methyltransferase